VTTRYHVAIRRAEDGRILVMKDGSLPRFEVPAAPPWQVVTIVGDEVRARYGLDVVTLRAAFVGDADRLYEVDFCVGRPAAGSHWVDGADLVGALGDDLPADVRAAIAAGALDPAAGDRQPWYRAGWFAEMTDWIDGRLVDAGIRRRGPLSQVRSWGRAALVAFETDRGRLWAKDVPDVFAHEVAVTELLADIDPGVVPPVVAADRERSRVISEHVAGPVLASVRDQPAAWIATLARLAELQRVLAADQAALSVAGVGAAPLERLADELPELLADDDLLLVGRAGGLTNTEASTLRSRTDELVAACRTLAASGIPTSLEHGDLSASQVIVGEMGPVILDWSDGSLTHPFLSAASFLRETAGSGASGDELVEGYLGPWAGRGNGGREALALAGTVLPLHMAALHADRILPGLEQPWEMAGMVPAFLRPLAAPR
jgi:hypothetical protein